MATINVTTSKANSSYEFIGTTSKPGPSGGSGSGRSLTVSIRAVDDQGNIIENQPVSDPSIRIWFLWAEPVSGWTVASAGVTWSDSANQGTLYPGPSTASASSYFAYLDFPDQHEGMVTITVAMNSATTVASPGIVGPPATTTLEIKYDTRTVTATTPAVEVINSNEVANVAIHELHLVWTELVRDFSLLDCTISAGSLTSMTAINPTPDLRASQYVVRWTIPTSGTGNATFTVAQDSARGATRRGPSTAYSVNLVYSAASVTTIFEDGTTTAATVTATHEQTYAQANGAYYGVNEMIVHGGNIYATVQKVNNLGSTPNDFLAFNQRGTAELLQISSGSVSSIQKYQDTLTAPRGFVSYDAGNGSQLHFFRGDSRIYEREIDQRGKPVQRRTETNPENWREIVGGIYKFSTSTPTLLGRAGRSDLTDPEPVTFSEFDNPDGHKRNPNYGTFGGTISPLLVDTNDLYYLSGFGDQSRIGTVPVGDVEANPESHINNWLLSIITKTLQYRVDLLTTNDRTLFDIIDELSKLSISAYYFAPNGRFIYRPNEAFSAELNADITATSNEFTTKNPSHTTISTSGTRSVLIEDEVLQYTSFSSGSASNVTRGLHGTTAAPHSANTKIYWIDHFFGFESDNEILNTDFAVIQNRQNIYNSIIVNYGTNEVARAKDSTSISSYGLAEYEFRIPASEGQEALADYIAKVYLQRLKNPREEVTIVTPLNAQIDVMQTAYIRDPYLTYAEFAALIVEVQHTMGTTQLKAIKVG